MIDTDSQTMKILLALFLGVLIGIQKEMHIRDNDETTKFMGIRTTIFIAILGVVSTFFYNEYYPVIIFLALTTLIIVSHTFGAFKFSRIDITTELSGFLVFFIGVLIGTEKQILAIVLTIIIVIVNTFKEQINSFIGNLSRKEWLASVQLLVFSGAILPFLPNKSLAVILNGNIKNLGIDEGTLLYFILDDIVLFKIWLLVLFISGIGFIGYFLSKFIGAKGGIPISAFLGGLSSSTAVTISLSNQEKSVNKSGNSSIKTLVFVSGILIASAIMQFRVIIEIFIVGRFALGYDIFIILFSMAILSLLLALYYILKYNKEAKLSQESAKIELSSPFEIIPAIKFAMFYLFILVLVNIVIFYGNKETGNGDNQILLYIIAFVSGFSDVDAITLKSIGSTIKGLMTAEVATITISIAVFMNTLIKILYVYINGSRYLVKHIAILIIIICLFGAILTYNIV